jgi:hypothetical protein
MFQQIIRTIRNRHQSNKARPKTFRPELLVLEGRVTPANCTWVGNGIGDGALWSVPANWSDKKIPGPNDVAVFDGTFGANTDSTMDLGGAAGSYHVGKLWLVNGTGTITLNANLWVDILDMRSRAIKGNKKLVINQSTGNEIPATMFGTSFWKWGTLEVSSVEFWGEDEHRATLEISSKLAVNLNSDLLIANQFSTVNWVDGNVNVAKGKTVTNNGTFFADSPGTTMGNDGGAADMWTFKNNKDLMWGAGKFRNAEMTKGAAAARERKVTSASPGPDRFEIAGTFTQDVASTLLSIESGTLYIDGPFTQSAGDVVIADGAKLEVTGSYNISGGTVAVNGAGSDTSLFVGSYVQSGGIATVTGGTLDSASIAIVSGGTLTLAPSWVGSVMGRLGSASNVIIEGGGTLRGVGAVVFDDPTGTLINDGTISVDGVVNPPYMNPVGTLSVTGNYAQTGAGVLNLAIFDESDYDKLAVSGFATLAGTLNVTPPPGVPEVTLEGPLDVFEVITYGERSGVFDTIYLPPLSGSSFWNPPQYDHPDYPNSLSLWAVT